MQKNIGKITRCQICNTAQFEPIINLGHQPPCDLLPDKKGLNKEWAHYPLTVVRCTQCGLVQLDFIPPPQVVFHKEYPYRTGITQMLVDNFTKLADETTRKLRLKKNSLVIDIGSNDGTALQQFKNNGMRVLGIEPTNIALLAQKNNIPTIQGFFSEEIAKKIVKKHGTASLVTATNVFAHINNLNSFMNGVNALLAPGGVFISESQYLLDTIEKVQYDTMYHEHLRFYSLKPLKLLFKNFGFILTDAQRIASSGGSIQVFAIKGKNLKATKRLAQLIKKEEEAGLYKGATYVDFKNRVEQSRLNLMKLLHDLKHAGKKVTGIGSPGRSSLILNYCGIDSFLVPYLAEQSTSLKLGLYSPGTHIPIVDEKKLFEEQPDYALLFSWHISDTLIKKLRARGLKSRFIVPLPDVKII
ncbi:MAG: class I SAM-dependent methyltransferase [bacterium]|nr:class I SAM-dependent methyltransferase [bacterium]